MSVCLPVCLSVCLYVCMHVHCKNWVVICSHTPNATLPLLPHLASRGRCGRMASTDRWCHPALSWQSLPWNSRGFSSKCPILRYVLGMLTPNVSIWPRIGGTHCNNISFGAIIGGRYCNLLLHSMYNGSVPLQIQLLHLHVATALQRRRDSTCILGGPVRYPSALLPTPTRAVNSVIFWRKNEPFPLRSGYQLPTTGATLSLVRNAAVVIARCHIQGPDLSRLDRKHPKHPLVNEISKKTARKVPG